jgi:hypothetical protein
MAKTKAQNPDPKEDQKKIQFPPMLPTQRRWQKPTE